MPDEDSEQRRPRPAPRPLGAGLLLIGALAVVRAWMAAAPPPSAWTAGEVINLDVESLSGEDFRLLPGVGEALAQRLEAARVAAGGTLTESDVSRVSGVGPSLRRRWSALRSR